MIYIWLCVWVSAHHSDASVDRLRNAEDDGVGDRDAVAKLMMDITGGYC